jgi:hypothetical protein
LTPHLSMKNRTRHGAPGQVHTFVPPRSRRRGGWVGCRRRCVRGPPSEGATHQACTTVMHGATLPGLELGGPSGGRPGCLGWDDLRSGPPSLRSRAQLLGQVYGRKDDSMPVESASSSSARVPACVPTPLPQRGGGLSPVGCASGSRSTEGSLKKCALLATLAATNEIGTAPRARSPVATTCGQHYFVLPRTTERSTVSAIHRASYLAVEELAKRPMRVGRRQPGVALRIWTDQLREPATSGGRCTCWAVGEGAAGPCRVIHRKCRLSPSSVKRRCWTAAAARPEPGGGRHTWRGSSWHRAGVRSPDQ